MGCRPTDFSGVDRHGVTRDSICQRDGAVSPHSYFAAGGAVVGLGPMCVVPRDVGRKAPIEIL